MRNIFSVLKRTENPILKRFIQLNKSVFLFKATYVAFYVMAMRPSVICRLLNFLLMVISQQPIKLFICNFQGLFNIWYWCNFDAFFLKKKIKNLNFFSLFVILDLVIFPASSKKDMIISQQPIKLFICTFQGLFNIWYWCNFDACFGKNK